ncbi:MAG: divalent-cation tolerance protein CutA [Bryobacteraceae bacterium]|nr:divalent-cation tolerance protein CutA [Bryobacteraceae bacterium]
MTEKIAVLSTAGSVEEAGRIARHLVDRRVAACVNIVAGARSVYRWKGNIEEAEEWLLIIKTRRVLFEQLQVELKSVHSYEVPEIIALPVVEGSQPYLDWLTEETS